MKRITVLPSGAYDMREYQDYILSLGDKMPPGLLAFTRRIALFDIHDDWTMHDSRFVSIEVYKALESGSLKRLANLKVAMPFGRKVITLKYIDVFSFNIAAPLLENINELHQEDWILDEIDIDEEKGLVSHEIVFSSGAVISLYFADLDFIVEGEGRLEVSKNVSQ